MKKQAVFLTYILSLVVLLVGGLAGSQDAIAQDEEDILRAGDVVRITVYGQADLNTVTRIADNGNISFRKRVQEARLSGIGRTAQNNLQTIANDLSPIEINDGRPHGLDIDIALLDETGGEGITEERAVGSGIAPGSA